MATSLIGVTDDAHPDSARSRRPHRRRVVLVVGLTAALFLGGGLGISLHSGESTPAAAGRTDAALDANGASAVSPTGAGSSGEISRLQRRLADEPENAQAWAALGSAYVQQARVTLDASFYPRAQGALERSLSLSPHDNLPALVGMGALANARHDFAGAAGWGRKAVAVSPYDPNAYAVLTDAYTQLGRAGAATRAVQKMLDLSPALPALTRGSYDLEQRGDRAGAVALMQRALDDAFTPTDVGFCRYYLGELAFSAGDLDTASKQYALGLIADPQSAPLMQGQAKVAALTGHLPTALAAYSSLVQRVPSPQYLIEYGELLIKAGQPGEAAAQFALVAAENSLFAANGGQDDLALAEYEGDHGSAAKALNHAKTEWSRRHSPVVADALAWALHRTGDDKQALHFAMLANARGWRSALFAWHLSQIEEALGNRAAADRAAATMRSYNPQFDPTLPALGRPS